MHSSKLFAGNSAFSTRRAEFPKNVVLLLDRGLSDAVICFARFAEKFRTRAQLVFVEGADGTFEGPRDISFQIGDADGLSTVNFSGTDVQFRLSPQNFVFAELDLPAAAEKYLAGILRSEIDRLTPWKAAEAVYGWRLRRTEPRGRIIVSVAATARKRITPLLGTIAERIILSTAREESDESITVLAFGTRSQTQHKRWRTAILSAFFVGGLSAATALGLRWTIGVFLDERAKSLEEEIRSQTSAVRGANDLGGSTWSALYEKKRHTAAVVEILEALSRALPDDAYLTAMHLEGNTLEISGVAADAAALIPSVEGSTPFSRATFVAPTTRDRDAHENFRIQAHVASPKMGHP